MKKVLVSILVSIIIMSLITVVNAASGSISASASSNQVTRGNTFTIIVSGTADNNISGLQAKLSYDKTKLERVISGSDLSGENEIAAVVNNQMKSGELYTLTFKVLDSAELGDTTINITDATLALEKGNGEQDNVLSLSSSATVKIVEDTTTAAGVTDQSKEDELDVVEDTGSVGDSSKKTTPSSEKSTSSSKSTSSKSSSNSSSKKTLPQTGVEIVSVIGIAVLSVVAIISYKSYRKYKNL